MSGTADSSSLGGASSTPPTWTGIFRNASGQPVRWTMTPIRIHPDGTIEHLSSPTTHSVVPINDPRIETTARKILDKVSMQPGTILHCNAIQGVHIQHPSLGSLERPASYAWPEGSSPTEEQLANRQLAINTINRLVEICRNPELPLSYTLRTEETSLPAMRRELADTTTAHFTEEIANKERELHDLRGQLRGSEEENARLQSRIRDLENNLSEGRSTYSRELTALENRISALTSTSAADQQALRNEIESLKSRLQEQEHTHETAQERIRGLTEELATRSSDYERVNEELSSTRRNHEILIRNLTNERDILLNKNSDIPALNEKIASLESELAHARATHQEELAAITESLESERAQRDTLSKTLRSTETTRATLEERLREREDELSRATLSLESARRGSDAGMEAKERELSAQTEASTQREAGLNTEIESLRAQINTLQSEKAQREEGLQKERVEHARLTSELRALGTELEGAQGASLPEQARHLEDQLQRTTANIAQLKQDISQKTQLSNDLERQVANLTEELKNITRAIDYSNEEISDLQGQVDHLQVSLEARSARMVDLEDLISARRKALVENEGERETVGRERTSILEEQEAIHSSLAQKEQAFQDDLKRAERGEEACLDNASHAIQTAQSLTEILLSQNKEKERDAILSRISEGSTQLSKEVRGNGELKKIREHVTQLQEEANRYLNLLDPNDPGRTEIEEARDALLRATQQEEGIDLQELGYCNQNLVKVIRNVNSFTEAKEIRNDLSTHVMGLLRIKERLTVLLKQRREARLSEGQNLESLNGQIHSLQNSLQERIRALTSKLEAHIPTLQAIQETPLAEMTAHFATELDQDHRNLASYNENVNTMQERARENQELLTQEQAKAREILEREHAAAALIATLETAKTELQEGLHSSLEELDKERQEVERIEDELRSLRSILEGPANKALPPAHRIERMKSVLAAERASSALLRERVLEARGLEAKISHLTEEREALETRLTTSEGGREALLSELTEKDSTLAAIKAERDQLELRNEQSHAQHTEFLEALEGMLGIPGEDFSASRDIQETLTQGRILDLLDHLTRRAAEADTLRDENSQQREALTSLRKDNAQLNEKALEADRLKNAHAQQEARITELTVHNQAVDELMEQIQGTNKELTLRNQELIKTLSSIEERFATERAHFTQREEALQHEVSTKEATLREAQSRAHKVQEERSLLLREVEELEDPGAVVTNPRLLSLQKRISELDATNKQEQRQIDHLEVENRRLQYELDLLRNQHATQKGHWQDDLQSLQGRYALLEKTLAEQNTRHTEAIREVISQRDQERSSLRGELLTTQATLQKERVRFNEQSMKTEHLLNESRLETEKLERSLEREKSAREVAEESNKLLDAEIRRASGMLSEGEPGVSLERKIALTNEHISELERSLQEKTRTTQELKKARDFLADKITKDTLERGVHEGQEREALGLIRSLEEHIHALDTELEKTRNSSRQAIEELQTHVHKADDSLRATSSENTHLNDTISEYQASLQKMRQENEKLLSELTRTRTTRESDIQEITHSTIIVREIADELTQKNLLQGKSIEEQEELIRSLYIQRSNKILTDLNARLDALDEDSALKDLLIVELEDTIERQSTELESLNSSSSTSPTSIIESEDIETAETSNSPKTKDWSHIGTNIHDCLDLLKETIQSIPHVDHVPSAHNQNRLFAAKIAKVFEEEGLIEPHYDAGTKVTPAVSDKRFLGLLQEFETSLSQEILDRATTKRGVGSSHNYFNQLITDLKGQVAGKLILQSEAVAKMIKLLIHIDKSIQNHKGQPYEINSQDLLFLQKRCVNWINGLIQELNSLRPTQ